MIHFLSFASSNMAPTLHRIGKEARQSGFFDKIHLYTDKKLDKTFYREHKDWFKENPRGYGYWIWKPYLISSILNNKMKDNDILVYLDAGCEIHQSGKHRWQEYLTYLENLSLIIYQQANNTEKQWTKFDIFDYFNVVDNQEIINSKQYLDGLIILKKNNFTSPLVEEWYQICETYKQRLLSDAPSLHPEMPEFIENRHDQSIFSILCKTKQMTETGMKEIKVLPVSECWTETDWSKMNAFPFWAKRNKTFTKPSIMERVISKIKSYLWKL